MRRTQRKSVSSDEARRLILAGKAANGLDVQGSLDFSSEPSKFALPADLSIWSLKINDQPRLHTLPARLRCNILEMRNSGIESLPADLHIEYRLDLGGCSALTSLPRGLKVGSLVLIGCTALTHLPEGLECSFLNIAGCSNLRQFPRNGRIQTGNLLARNCVCLTRLPTWLTNVAQLDVSGCSNIKAVPPNLEVTSWIDVGKSGIRALPSSLDHVEVRWRGVPVSRRIAFEPEKISAAEVLSEVNVESRRAMLESMGLERFLREANAEVLDTDHDRAGSERNLLRVPLENDEDVVCVSVTCPSTSRQYLIRVPPDTKSCRQAVAWTAGFDDDRKYHPAVET